MMERAIKIDKWLSEIQIVKRQMMFLPFIKLKTFYGDELYKIGVFDASFLLMVLLLILKAKTLFGKVIVF